MKKKIVLCILLMGSASVLAKAEQSTTPKRPIVLFNRWQEDWSVLADPQIQRENFDRLKYIPYSPEEPETYLSFGINIRERYENNESVNFSVGDSVPQSYVISRSEVHADLRIANQLQGFIQLQSDFAPGKAIMTPVDQNRLDTELAFITLVEQFGDGIFKFRFGRQQYAFDLQRFISVRDGPNVRQSYDAIWADYEIDKTWRLISFYSQPVVTRNNRAFDDYSSNSYTYSGFRAERKVTEHGAAIAYVSHFKQDKAKYLNVTGNEGRNILDVRVTGNNNGFDGDVELMGQVGSIADKHIRAWALGSLFGYTFKNAFWTPRLGIQIDAASGNHDKDGNTLGTFNPLFPNGYYFTLAGYTGYVNLVHVKPSLVVVPSSNKVMLFAVGTQWRETTADAVYTQPNIPVPGTAGEGGYYTGAYLQFRFDWKMSNHFTSAVEAVHFIVAEALQAVDGKNADYVGVEIKFGW
jgi:hypothetical protein